MYNEDFFLIEQYANYKLLVQSSEIETLILCIRVGYKELPLCMYMGGRRVKFFETTDICDRRPCENEIFLRFNYFHI